MSQRDAPQSRSTTFQMSGAGKKGVDDVHERKQCPAAAAAAASFPEMYEDRVSGDRREGRHCFQLLSVR